MIRGGNQSAVGADQIKHWSTDADTLGLGRKRDRNVIFVIERRKYHPVNYMIRIRFEI